MMATNLETKLFAVADELRGNMDANEYKNYILGFIFYRYLSEKQENYLNEELKLDDITFQEACEDEEWKKELKEDSINRLGYFINPEYLFSSIIEKCKTNQTIRNDLKQAFSAYTMGLVAGKWSVSYDSKWYGESVRCVAEMEDK